jgi:putative endonuclease
LCFIEVKTRASNSPVSPEFSVSKKQEKRIISAAHYYIINNEIDLEIRFDIIAITSDKNELNLEHINNAFYPILD